MNSEQPVTTLSPKLDIGNTISEAWKLVSGLKGPIWILYLISIVICIPIVIIGFLMVPPTIIQAPPGQPPIVHWHMIHFLCAILVMCLYLGIACVMTMAGVRQAIGLPPKLRIIFADCIRVKNTLLPLILVWMAIWMGYTVADAMLPQSALGQLLRLVLYLLTIYLTLVIQLFALPLIVTKRCNLQFALKEAYRTMNKHISFIIVSFFALVVIMFISILPFGIGIIWTLPMYFAWMGIVFRDLCGLKKQ